MRIALGRVYETAPGLDAALLLGAILQRDYHEARDLLTRATQMFTRLAGR